MNDVTIEIKMNDLMIDLETLGTDPETPVISLGAVFFDIEKKTMGATFYMALDVDEQIKRGRKPTGSTLRWWMGQADAAKRVFNEKAKPSLEVLQTFSLWMKANNPKAHVWGNGSTFDVSIMEHLYKMYGLECPWGYGKIMDLRTFRRFQGKGAKVVVPGTAHNALDDAVGQAQYVLDHA
jgi:hypothetical protein